MTVDLIQIQLGKEEITLPNERVGMVLAQPFVSLTTTDPYRCRPESKPRTLSAISETLAVALAAHHGEEKTHFTIFPEYTIPGIDGIELIERTITSDTWPTGTVVIGGTDALSKEDFERLAHEPGTVLDSKNNSLDDIRSNEWINCCIIWIKTKSNTVKRWLQPKLSTAWLEQSVINQPMYIGKSIFSFKGYFEDETKFSFSVLVCFDWIATIGTQKPWQWMAGKLQQLTEDEMAISWLMVIQYNRKPSDQQFISEVSNFFNQQTFPKIRRDRTCLVFVNSAGAPKPGKVTLFGSSSLIFSPSAMFAIANSMPTFSLTKSNNASKFRLNQQMFSCCDLIFREGGACIHSFAQVNPNSLLGGSGGKKTPVVKACVFSILKDIDDPRSPGSEVPAAVKWINDELDGISQFIPNLTHKLIDQIGAQAHQKHISAIRSANSATINEVVSLAACDPQRRLVDEWDQVEKNAVEHILQSINLVSLGYSDLRPFDKLFHATINIEGCEVCIVAARNESHEICLDKVMKFIKYPQGLILLISRDKDETAWDKRFGSFLTQQDDPFVNDGDITNPMGGWRQIGRQNLLGIITGAQTSGDIQLALKKEIKGES